MIGYVVATNSTLMGDTGATVLCYPVVSFMPTGCVIRYLSGQLYYLHPYTRDAYLTEQDLVVMRLLGTPYRVRRPDPKTISAASDAVFWDRLR